MAFRLKMNLVKTNVLLYSLVVLVPLFSGHFGIWPRAKNAGIFARDMELIFF